MVLVILQFKNMTASTVIIVMYLLLRKIYQNQYTTIIITDSLLILVFHLIRNCNNVKSLFVSELKTHKHQYLSILYIHLKLLNPYVHINTQLFLNKNNFP